MPILIVAALFLSGCFGALLNPGESGDAYNVRETCEAKLELVACLANDNCDQRLRRLSRRFARARDVDPGDREAVAVELWRSFPLDEPCGAS